MKAGTKKAAKSGQSHPSGPLDTFLAKRPCIKFTDHISPHFTEIAQTKSNITVGFGCVSYTHGLSQGLPIDFLTMLFTAERFRNEVLPKNGKVIILIGDHFAQACAHPSCEPKEVVENVVNKYVKKIEKILTNLNVREHYEIKYSSQITQEPEYQKIKEELELKAQNEEFVQRLDKDTQQILRPGPKEKGHRYQEGHRWYFMEQTAVFKYLYDKHDCHTKISWARVTGSTARELKKVRESQAFDEAHFDRYYLQMLQDQARNLSFVYTMPGFAANMKDEHSKQIPYTAPVIPDMQRILLSKKQKLDYPTDPVNPHLIKVVAEQVDYIKSCLPQMTFCQDSKSGKSLTPFYENVKQLIEFSKTNKVANDEQVIAEDLTPSFAAITLTEIATATNDNQEKNSIHNKGGK